MRGRAPAVPGRGGATGVGANRFSCARRAERSERAQAVSGRGWERWPYRRIVGGVPLSRQVRFQGLLQGGHVRAGHRLAQQTVAIEEEVWHGGFGKLLLKQRVALRHAHQHLHCAGWGRLVRQETLQQRAHGAAGSPGLPNRRGVRPFDQSRLCKRLALRKAGPCVRVALRK